MKNTIKNTNLIILSIFVFIGLIGATNLRYSDLYELLDNAAKAVAVLGLLFSLLIDQKGFNGKLLTIGVILLFAISWVVSKDSSLFYSALFIAIGNSDTLKKFIKIYVIECGVVLLLAIILTACDNIEQTTLIIDGVVVGSFGFISPNRFAATLMSGQIGLYYIFFNNKKGTAFAHMTAILIALFSHLILKSDGGTIMALASIVFRLIVSCVRCKSYSKLRAFLAVASTIVILGSVAVSATFNPANPLLNSLNSATGGRIEYAHYYIENYGIHAFGKDYTASNQPIMYGIAGSNQATTFVVDNAYCHILLHYGIVPFLLFLIFHVRLVADKKYGDPISGEMFGYCLMILYGVVETVPLYICCNPFLLLLSWDSMQAESRLEVNAEMNNNNQKEEVDAPIKVQFDQIPAQCESEYMYQIKRIMNKISSLIRFRKDSR